MGSLVIMMWNFLNIEGIDIELFNVKREETDLLESMQLLSPNVTTVESYKGMYKPAK